MPCKTKPDRQKKKADLKSNRGEDIYLPWPPWLEPPRGLAGIGYGNGAYGSWPDPELLPEPDVPEGEDPEEDMVVFRYGS